MNRLVGVVAIAAGAAACGESNQSLGPGLPVGSLDAGTASDAPGGQVDPGSQGQVQIEILAPANQTVLASAMAPEIRARIRSLAGSGAPGSDPIVPDSVRFFVGTDDAKGPSVKGMLAGPSFTSEYTGRMDLTVLPTGRYLLAVTAATRAGAQGLARVEVLVDSGPRVTILSPRSGGAYKGSVAVEILVDAAPFDLGPAPEAFVGSIPIALAPGDGPGRFRAVLELQKFDPPLIDEQLLRVVAHNQQGTRAEASAVFLVDEDGPRVVETSPPPGTVVGGVIRVSARLEDPAGVLGPSVVAFIGNSTADGFALELLPEAAAPGTYSALFDTRKLTACRPSPDTSLCVVWPNLSFRAADLLGNETVVAYDLAIEPAAAPRSGSPEHADDQVRSPRRRLGLLARLRSGGPLARPG